MLKGLSHDEHYEVLRDYAKLVPDGDAIVEIGTYLGASAIELARGAREGHGAHVWTVDPHDLPGERSTTAVGPRPVRPIDFTDPTIPIQAQAAINAAGLHDQVTMVKGFSTDVAELWAGPKVGLLHVDGDHRAPSVRRDYAAWEQHLAADALILWDDHGQKKFPGVVETVDLLVRKGLLTVLEVQGALAVTMRVDRR